MSTEETPIASMAQFADAFDIPYDDTDPVANRAITLEQARRYVNSLNTSKQVLPDGYTQLEYLESSGSQYIDIGFGFQGSDDVEIDFQMTQAPTSAEGIFGGRDTGSARGYMLYAEARTDGFVFLYNNKYITNLNNDWYDRHVFKKNGTNIYFDGVANSQTVSASFTQTQHAFLFAWHTEGNQPNRSKTKIFSFIMTRSGSKYCELIPAKRDSDGVLGMYDIVRDTFLTNAGTGSFIAGPTYSMSENESSYFPQDYDILNYIESNGSQSLDTGYNPNSNTRVVLDYNLTQLTGKWMGIFAARDLNGYANQYAYWSNETGKYRSNYSGETGILFGSQNTKRHIIDKNKAILKEDGIVVASHPAATFSCGCSLHIFCGNTGGTLEHYAHMRLYSCKIYDDGFMVRDYVPCKQKSTGLYGLFDKVNREFYSSCTNTGFIGGSIVEQPDVGNRVLTLSELNKLFEIYGRKYILLEYISLDGNQFVDTGYYSTNKTRVQCKLYLEATQKDGSVAIYGGRTGVGSMSFSLWRTGSSTFRQDYGGKTRNISLSTSGMFTIDANQNTTVINTTSSYIELSNTFTATHTFKIASNYTTAGGYHDGKYNESRRFIGKLYYFKISDNGQPIRDYIPVKRISDGAIGLYDKVNKLFYGNDGTGSFGAGPEVGYI